MEAPLDSPSPAPLADLRLGLVDALFPPACPLCGARDLGDGLGCADHHLHLGLGGKRCGKCAAPLPPALPDGERCARCRERAPGFERLLALGDYRSGPALREWILALKHRRRPDLARTLGRALGALLRERGERRAVHTSSPVLAPVPLHFLRRIERGYDQALLLARAAGEVENLSVVRALRRRRATLVQGAPGSASRRANVRGAFAPRLFAARRIAGREVWIVDDVVTSGSTAAECARVLRRMGALRVCVLALARA